MPHTFNTLFNLIKSDQSKFVSIKYKLTKQLFTYKHKHLLKKKKHFAEMYICNTKKRVKPIHKKPQKEIKQYSLVKFIKMLKDKDHINGIF